MSPSLLSKRLKDLEARKLVRRAEDEASGGVTYHTTPLADELQSIVYALGEWAHVNIDAEVTLEHLDARLLMWNMRRKIDTNALSARKLTVVQFTYPELAEGEQNYWLVAKRGKPIDLCSVDPGHPVDLYVTADLRSMTAAWMGHSTFAAEIRRDRITLVGDRQLIDSLPSWLVRSSYASLAKPVRKACAA